jgi:tRNA (mo5U34)-methyltransferase
MTFEHVRTWKREYEASGWWHSFELPDGTIIEGRCNLVGLKQRLANFPIPGDLTGKRVLDIGTWDGWYAFELARRGAKVVAIDCWDNPRFHEMRRVFNLEDRVEYRLMDVYEIAPEVLGRFDVVMFLGVLYHLKHPLLALEKLCAVTDELACIDSFVLRDPDRPELQLDGRLVMEFFETDEFGGQTDNWIAPSASCLAAFCRTAGFARAELVGNLQYSASFACYRRWITPPTEWGLAPRLIDAVHHLDFGLNFSSTRDDYIVAWFSLEGGHFRIQDVFPEVSGYGIRPIQVGRQGSNWMTTFKLPPGLPPGWHEVRVRVRGSRLSEPLPIAVDLPVTAECLRITAAVDGATWKDNEVDLSRGNIVAVWVSGIPDNADHRCVRAKVDRRPAEITYIGPAGVGDSRQVNVVVPSDGGTEYAVEIAFGGAKASYQIRRVG